MTRRRDTRTAGLLALFLAAGAGADPDEAWLRRAPLPPETTALLGLILDRSVATARTGLTVPDYEPATDYGARLPATGRCDPGRVYFRRGAGPAPDCGVQPGVDYAPRSPSTGLHCEAARGALAVTGFFVAARAAQWRADAEGGWWSAPAPGSAAALECRADRGRHGEGPGAWFARAGTGAAWTTDAAQEIDWDRPPFGDAVILYAGNFLNYLRAPGPAIERSLAERQARGLADALASTAELDVALLHVDDDGPDGGYVARAPVPSDAAAAEVAALAAEAPAGAAPLAETLVEAALWLAGASPRFGIDDRADPDARVPGSSGDYRSPFTQACRPISLAFASAGEPVGDDQAAAAAAALPRFMEETGGCGAECTATLGQWLGGTDLRADLPGLQSAPLAWLLDAADPLAAVNLVASAFQHDAGVPAAPQLSSGTLVGGEDGEASGLVFGLIAPRPRARWLGNLLRYALAAPTGPLAPPSIVDRDGAPAFDAASGLPRPGSRSAWSDAPDADLLAGGAAGRLPPPGSRRLQSDVASERLLDPANRLEPGTPRIDRAMLGLGPADPESVDELLDALAQDPRLGDLGRDPPVFVDDRASGLRLVLSAGQDGLLQAFDAQSGVEHWAWMPQELLAQVPERVRDRKAWQRSPGIDGKLVLHQRDVNGDGRIAAADGDHRWLLFGLGRGGARYYALDLARADDPRLMWRFELDDPSLFALAEPVVTRLPIAGSGQSSGDWIVLLAGGHDPRFDVRGAGGHGRGARLHLVDAQTGRALWSAGEAGSGPPLADLASLPSAPRALDLDGDGYLDRAYLLDVTGALWRLDFRDGSPADDLASAWRVARLGDGTRRFFATPDAALVRRGRETRLAVAAGSGWITRPLDGSIADRMSVVFDALAGTGPRELTEDALFDATAGDAALPADAPGWTLRLDARGPGEKVAGPAVSFDHVLRFLTVRPLAPDPAEPCGPPRTATRLLAIDLRTALPRNLAAESEPDEEPEEIAVSGLPGELRFGFPGRWSEACAGCRPRPFGIAGASLFDTGYAGDPVRTSWRKLAPPPASR